MVRKICFFLPSPAAYQHPFLLFISLFIKNFFKRKNRVIIRMGVDMCDNFQALFLHIWLIEYERQLFYILSTC